MRRILRQLPVPHSTALATSSSALRHRAGWGSIVVETPSLWVSTTSVRGFWWTSGGNGDGDDDSKPPKKGPPAKDDKSKKPASEEPDVTEKPGVPDLEDAEVQPAELAVCASALWPVTALILYA